MRFLIFSPQLNSLNELFVLTFIYYCVGFFSQSEKNHENIYSLSMEEWVFTIVPSPRMSSMHNSTKQD